MIRSIAKVLLWAVAAALVVSSAALGYRAWRIHAAEKELAITAPNGIDEALFVPIGATEQWITIRGHDRRNPIVLVVHGGPGVGMGPFAPSLTAYERSYTLVQWDQPGAGKTFRRAGNRIPADLTIDAVARDGIAVAEIVRSRLGGRKVILLGWSWGSLIGAEMARSRPDLFAAFVGTGQIANMRAGEALVYERVLDKAKAQANAQAVRDLEAIGPPPYESLAEINTQRQWAMALAGEETPTAMMLRLLAFAPRYSLLDTVSFAGGMFESGNHFFGPEMNGPVMDVDLVSTAASFEVPVVFIQGSEDDFTPAALARGYFDRLVAPGKAYVSLEGAGHMALITHVDEFLAALDEHVRPVAD